MLRMSTCGILELKSAIYFNTYTKYLCGTTKLNLKLTENVDNFEVLYDFIIHCYIYFCNDFSDLINKEPRKNTWRVSINETEKHILSNREISEILKGEDTYCKIYKISERLY